MGQVTLSTEEYHDIINQRQTAEKALAAAQREVIAARSEDPSGRLAAIIDGFKSALEVVSFAVGNLPAESYRGWPHAALVRVADAVLAMPECGSNERDLAGEYKKFAAEAAAHEMRRMMKKPTVLLSDEGDGGSPG